jgi:Family of unknown function (DUF6334)
MLDTLGKIHDAGGPLVGVSYLLFEGHANFITAVSLRFESVSVLFRAVAEDDSLAVILGPLMQGEDESMVEAASTAPWSRCIGFEVRWAWRLTNQQGYTDGVRLEFGNPDDASRSIIELIVAASAIEMFVATRKD